MPSFVTQYHVENMQMAATVGDDPWRLSALFQVCDGGNGGGKGAMYPDPLYGLHWSHGPRDFHKGP